MVHDIALIAHGHHRRRESVHLPFFHHFDFEPSLGSKKASACWAPRCDLICLASVPTGTGLLRGTIGYNVGFVFDVFVHRTSIPTHGVDWQ